MARLKLGSIDLWAPPHIFSELTGYKNNYSSSLCGSTLESTELTYRLFLSRFCTLAETQQLQAAIEAELALAPGVMLERQETPDALIFRNTISKGELQTSSDRTEIRARFTRNRTLAFTLTLTILAGDANGISIFRPVKLLQVTSSFDWTLDDIRAMLYMSNSTIPSELYADTLDDFITKGEADGVGYSRITIDGRSVEYGSVLTLVADDLEFGVVANGSDTIAGIVIYQHNGADSSNIPLFLIPLSPFQPGGFIQPIPLNLSGLF